MAQNLFEDAISSSPAIEDASRPEINGFIRSVAYMGQEEEGKDIYFQSVYSQLALQPSIKLGSQAKAYADIRFRYGYEFDEKLAEINWNEIYASLAFGPVVLDAGKKVQTWGSTSFINPTDQFAPVDPIFRSPEPDDQRTGIWSLSGTVSLNSSSSLKFLYIPIHTPSKLMTSAFEFPEYVKLNDYYPGRVTLKDGSFGLYYDLRSEWLDLQLSYFQGYRNLPGIILDTVIFNQALPGIENIVLRERPYNFYCPGINLAIPFSSYIFRMEGAGLFMDQDEVNIPFSELSYAAEIEQSGDNVTLIGGYYGKYIIDFKETRGSSSLLSGKVSNLSSLIPQDQPPTPELINSLVSDQINYFNSLYNYQQDEYYHSVYASLRIDLLYDKLKFEIPAIYNITTKELAFMPSLKVSITDGLYLQLGSYFLHGKKETLFDFIAPGLNAGFAMLKLEF